MDAQDLKTMDKQIRENISTAAETAKETEAPAPSELYTDIYATDDNFDD